jgi:hypothetical protein
MPSKAALIRAAQGPPVELTYFSTGFGGASAVIYANEAAVLHWISVSCNADGDDLDLRTTHEGNIISLENLQAETQLFTFTKSLVIFRYGILAVPRRGGTANWAGTGSLNIGYTPISALNIAPGS